MRNVKFVMMLMIAGVMTAGCVGTYSNKARFVQDPKTGMLEADMVRTYGAPAFKTQVENENLYVYKVRDNKYIVLIGLYEGYDIVVTARAGEVKAVDRIARPQTFTLLNPVPWAEAE